MSNTIGHNKFYNTFTPFLTPKTKTAEKTINGKDFIVKEPPYNMLKNFYTYIFAGGFLLLPILAITISKNNISNIIQKSNIDCFKALQSENQSLFSSIGKRFTLQNNTILKKLKMLFEPIFQKQECFTSKLNDSSNQGFFAKIFRKTNNILTRGKENAAIRQQKSIVKHFDEIEKVLEERLNLISESAKGNLKILFPKELLKTPIDELPKAIDISKTASGQDRAEAIRAIITKIKTLLKDNPENFEKIVPQITNSCEDIFFKAEKSLMELQRALDKQGINTEAAKELIGNLYKNFSKYRYAQVIPEQANASCETLRNIHLENIKNCLDKLKSSFSAPEKIKTQLENLENVIYNDTRPENMGLLEQLRKLLKCSDIKSEYIIDGKQPALFKYFRPEEYINIKREIRNLAKELKFAQKTQNKIIPEAINSINNGSVFVDGLSLAIPTGYLIYKNINNKKESNHNNKRNLISFLAGGLTLMGSKYFTLNSNLMSVLYGFGASLLTSRIFEILSKNKNSSK